MKVFELIEKVSDRIYSENMWAMPSFSTAYAYEQGISLEFRADQHTGACEGTHWTFNVYFDTKDVDEMLRQVEHGWQTLWNATSKTHD